ncbi:HNH endonuclease [Rhizobium leguminosarum]|nr:HNH endonuclease [Rhizobium leguminosarum]
MQIYNGRCVVTGCAVGEVLQAAHIIPFSEAVQFRDDPKNGLLLRADIHVLFDKLLLSIHPRTGQIHLAPGLPGTTYKSLEGRVVRHQASKDLLIEQYRLCKAVWSAEAEI